MMVKSFLKELGIVPARAWGGGRDKVSVSITRVRTLQTERPLHVTAGRAAPRKAAQAQGLCL